MSISDIFILTVHAFVDINNHMTNTEATKYSKQIAKVINKLAMAGLKEEADALTKVAQKRYAEMVGRK